MATRSAISLTNALRTIFFVIVLNFAGALFALHFAQKRRCIRIESAQSVLQSVCVRTGGLQDGHLGFFGHLVPPLSSLAFPLRITFRLGYGLGVALGKARGA